MDFDMAPPAKRRRLTSADDKSNNDRVSETQTASGSFFHGIEHFEAETAVAPAVEAQPRIVEEVHLEIRHRHVADLNDYAHIKPRQGTAASAEVSVSVPEVLVSVQASVDIFGSTAVATTETITNEPPGGTLLSGIATTTVVISPGATSSSTASSTESSDPASTSAGDVNAAAVAAETSGASSTNSTESSTTSTSSVTSLSSDPAGFIGISAGAVTTTASSSAAQASVSISESSASNSSSTISTSVSSTIGSSALSSSLLSSFSERRNLTTSATTYTSGGSTFTSQTTIDLGAIISSNTESSSTASSTNFGAGNIYLATLAGGRVATITRSNRAYATTFPGGLVSTIQPSSTSSGSDDQTSSLDPNEYVTTVVSDGSTFLSTVFSTTTPSPTDGGTAAGEAGATGAVAGQGSPTTAATSSTSSAAAGGAGVSTPPPAGTIAGGVVGGAAGLAVVLLVAMLFLRWYRKKGHMRHQALPAGSVAMSPDPDNGLGPRGGPGMAERAGLMPFVAAVPGLFRHQNRSRDSAADVPESERGFTRVSGRKLPSAWSEGMTSASHPPMPPMSNAPPPMMPIIGAEHSRDLSDNSFYRDSAGTYAGVGEANRDSVAGRSTSPSNPFADLSPIDTNITPEGEDTQMVMSPGPRRTPTVHHGGPYVMSPTTASSDPPGMLSPGQPPWSAGTQATFARSETPASMDGSRGSRFTEEV
nr:hypothetical protein B0A51_10107 [Rachicladosporium sp. CCFEE 5018]OQO25467.1 hypothetical protein B0A51_07336 [Rachicladosporium sp. CCFEE 5018]